LKKTLRKTAKTRDFEKQKSTIFREGQLAELWSLWNCLVNYATMKAHGYDEGADVVCELYGKILSGKVDISKARKLESFLKTIIKRRVIDKYYRGRQARFESGIILTGKIEWLKVTTN